MFLPRCRGAGHVISPLDLIHGLLYSCTGAGCRGGRATPHRPHGCRGHHRAMDQGSHGDDHAARAVHSVARTQLIYGPTPQRFAQTHCFAIARLAAIYNRIVGRHIPPINEPATHHAGPSFTSHRDLPAGPARVCRFAHRGLLAPVRHLAGNRRIRTQCPDFRGRVLCAAPLLGLAADSAGPPCRPFNAGTPAESARRRRAPAAGS